MSNFRDRYKQKRSGPNDAATSRMARAREHDERRSHNRTETFSRNRDVSPNPQIQVSETQETSSLDDRFRRWKLEKELKKKMEQKNKKPIFKVGVVHHNFYSPVANDTINNAPSHSRGADRVTRRSPPKRITRATQKRLAAKMAASATATSFQPHTTDTALSMSYSQPSTSANAACATPSEPGTSSTELSMTYSKSSTNVAAACATPSKPGTSGVALSMTYSKSSTSATAAFATPSEAGTSCAAFSMTYSLSSTSAATPCASFAPQYYPFERSVCVEETPMFRSSAMSRDFLPEGAHSNEVEARWASPRPSTGNILAPLETVRNKRKRFVRQNAIESLTWTGTSEQFSSEEDSLVEDRSKKVVLDSLTDATTFLPGTSEDVAVDTVTCLDSPHPVTFSPHVTSARGSRSKMSMGCTPPDDVPTNETDVRSQNVSVEEEERTAQYFKLVLQREIERLNEICAKWEKVKGEPSLTEDARYLINQAIGQTMLLVRNKFKRFRSLVADCETGKGEMLVRCRDLHGFWDMTYVEVKNCDARFQKLVQLQSTGWVEEDIVVTTKRPTGIRKKLAANKFTMNAKSSKPKGNTDYTPREKTLRSVESSPPNVPRFAKRASLKITPKETPASLLKKIQLSKPEKHARSSLAVTKISRMCKTPEIRLDETISYINSEQTPSRGILQKSDETSTTDIAVAKSTRKVDFNDDVPSQPRTDEHFENSIDLALPLARIESYDTDNADNVFEPDDISRTNVTLRRIEKRPEALPAIAIISPTPPRYASKSGVCPSMTTRARKRGTFIAHLPNEEKHSEDESLTWRVLRNRSVSARTPQKSARLSTKSSSARKKMVGLDSSAKENVDSQIPRRRSLSESSRIFDIECHSEEPSKIRRSTRKSVCFNAADCTACADSTKPVHPMTPHSRRSRKISLLGDVSRHSISPQFDGDLISFDSPTVPARIRRTSQASRKSSQ